VPTLLPPPVLDGGRLEEDPPEVEGVADLLLLDDPEPDPAGRIPGLGAPTAGLGNALPTAEPALAETPSLRGALGEVGEVGTRDITVLGYETIGREIIQAKFE
jgi:hypothetical protein